MTDPRAGIFAAFRTARPDVFADSGHILALDNLCDAFDIPRSAGQRQRRLAKPELFFAKVRTLTGGLDQVQVDTANRLLETAAHWCTGHLAYGFATAWHEARLAPVLEKGGDAYLFRMYDINGARPDKARELGNLTPGDGVRYAGRGLPQLTGRINYAKASKALGVDLIAFPDKVLEPQIAVDVMVWGMETGAFTTKKLSDYLRGDRGDQVSFTSARRIINGTDKAHLIAGYAETFQAALDAGGWA